jgi:hypothetical protein
VHEGLPAMQRRPEPQTAFGALPTQAASLQPPQSSVARPVLWPAQGERAAPYRRFVLRLPLRAPRLTRGFIST